MSFLKSIFSAFFGGGDISTPSLPPIAPGRGSTEADAAARRLRIAKKQRTGRQATILAGLGEEDDRLGSTVVRPKATSNTTQKQTTLG